MHRSSFVLYTDYYKHIAELSDEEAGQLIKAIFRYAMDEDPAIDSRVVKMAFSFIKNQIDIDTEKYIETCRKRAECGKLGGRPKANGFSEEVKKANGFSEKQTKAKKHDNENDNENENDNDIYKARKRMPKNPKIHNYHERSYNYENLMKGIVN